MSSPLNQGSSSTCVAHAFSKVLVDGIFGKYAVPLKIEDVLAQVKASCPCWNGSRIDKLPREWNKHVATNSDFYFEDVDNRYRYRVSVDVRRIETIEEAYAEVQKIEGVLLLMTSIATETDSHETHAVAVDKPYKKLNEMRGLNSWGATQCFMDVTRRNFKYAVTLDPIITAKKKGSRTKRIPEVTRGYIEMSHGYISQAWLHQPGMFAYANMLRPLRDLLWVPSHQHESGVTMRLVELLMHPSSAVQTSALHAVGNIVTGDDLQTQVVLDCGALPCLLSLLSSDSLRKEACWALSNINAGNVDQIQQVIDANLIPPLIYLLSRAKFDVKKEAAWAIATATSGGTPEQIEYLVSCGCIPPLCELLTVSDNKIVTVALESLENILKVGKTAMREKSLPENPCAQHVENAGGLDKIDQLQQHEDTTIYIRSLKILERYFGAVDAWSNGEEKKRKKKRKKKKRRRRKEDTTRSGGKMRYEMIFQRAVQHACRRYPPPNPPLYM